MCIYTYIYIHIYIYTHYICIYVYMLGWVGNVGYSLDPRREAIGDPQWQVRKILPVVLWVCR